MTSMAIAEAFPTCAEKTDEALKFNVQLFVFFVAFFATATLTVAGAVTMTPFAVITGGLLTAGTAITFALTTIFRSANCR